MYCTYYSIQIALRCVDCSDVALLMVNITLEVLQNLWMVHVHYSTVLQPKTEV